METIRTEREAFDFLNELEKGLIARNAAEAAKHLNFFLRGAGAATDPKH